MHMETDTQTGDTMKSAATKEALATIKKADGHAGGKRADILQASVEELAQAYISEMEDMGNSKLDAKRWLVETIAAIQ